MDKPFTSKHCTPLSMSTPLYQEGELKDLDSTVKGMQEYKAHQANMPQYKEGDSIGGHFNTTMKRIVHNMTGPSNPNLVGGTMSAGAAGRAGLIKGLVKLGAKAIKKYKESNINYGSPLNNNKNKTHGPSQSGIAKSFISTKIGPKENKGYTVENTTPKGLYTSDANEMTIKATSKKLPKK